MPCPLLEDWDEARLKALCARHGWEFEWMTEDAVGPGLEAAKAYGDDLVERKIWMCFPGFE